ncbi:unnamed protein product [Urochloa humidicola]
MGDLVGSVEKIVKIALAIKEAVETLEKNKKDCTEIGRRVARISAVLKGIPEEEMVKDPAMGDTLKALDESLTCALELIKACQKKNIMCQFCMSNSLSKQLLEVKQDITNQMVDSIFATKVSGTIIVRDIQYIAHPLSSQDAGVGIFSLSSDTTEDARSKKKNNGEKTSELVGLRKFSLTELEDATSNFSDQNLIARGAFGNVFEGDLHDGRKVAIKKFRNSIVFSQHHLYDELNLVSKLQHKNIVKLLGYGHEVAERMVLVEDKKVRTEQRQYFSVEEYMPNGSLEKIINGSNINWSSRFRIIKGIANGIHYLHQQHVVHSDLKPSNILLDSDMDPKISDFGIARILEQGDDLMTIQDVNCLAGTMGYMPPEYIVEGILTTKYDVFSFGIILLEIINGMCKSEPARRQASVDWMELSPAGI